MTLLQLAIALIIACQNPNLPADLRTQGLNLARQALESIQIAPQETPTVETSLLNQPTLPPPMPTPENLGTLVIEHNNEIQTDIDSNSNRNGTYHNIRAYYLEDGKKIAGITITVTADDEGTFTSEGKENTNSMLTRKGIAPDGGAGASFQYVPAQAGERTLTFTANGVSVTQKVNGK